MDDRSQSCAVSPQTLKERPANLPQTFKDNLSRFF
jgi:hypothetical protein